MRLHVSGLLLGVGLAVAAVAVGAPTIGYQGRITAQGTNYTGTGFFKFVLLNGAGQGLWANDGSSGSGQPAVAVPVEVNNGLFNVELGQGMQPIPPLALHQWGLKLRTWFSTNNSSFEQLSPDVELRPTRIESLDTGHTVIMNGERTGDFETIQDAINFLATNYEYNAILLMPGYYSLAAPLTFPTNRWGYSLCGLGERGTVHIENTNGPAMYPQRVVLSDLLVSGQPALADDLCEEDYWVQLSDCQFQRAGPGGAAVELSRSGWVECRNSTFHNNHGGPALRLGADTGFRATDCSFFVSAEAAQAVELVDRERGGQFERCSCFTDGSGGGDRLLVRGGTGDGTRWNGGELRGGVTITGSQHKVELSDCQLGPVLIADSDGGLELRNCRVEPQSNAALTVVNAGNLVAAQDCDFAARSAPVLVVAATPGGRANCRVSGSHLHNYAEGADTNHDAVVISNAAANSAWNTRITMENCLVEALRDAVHMDNAILQVARSQLNGPRDGVLVNRGEVGMDASSVSAGRWGMVCTNGVEAEIFWSRVSGGAGGLVAYGDNDLVVAHSTCAGGNESEGLSGDGIHFQANEGQLMVKDSSVEGEGSGSSAGRGLYALMTSPNALVVLMRAMVNADGEAPGLECQGGVLLASHCLFHSSGHAAAMFKHTNTLATLDNCTFYGMDGSNTNAAVLLYGVATNGAPTPRIAHAVIRPVLPGSTARYCIGLAGTVTTGRVALLNSVLSTNIDPRISIVPARTNLINGNIIP